MKLRIQILECEMNDIDLIIIVGYDSNNPLAPQIPTHKQETSRTNQKEKALISTHLY